MAERTIHLKRHGMSSHTQSNDAKLNKQENAKAHGGITQQNEYLTVKILLGKEEGTRVLSSLQKIISAKH